MAERTFLSEFELLVLLAVIRIEENAYGIPIAQEIKDRTGRDVFREFPVSVRRVI